ncbi:MAG: hypothetical protein JXJ04_24490 [Spirochaetales bacterium]|nr:hypothetical protein [Spirochaetales bacterium]
MKYVFLITGLFLILFITGCPVTDDDSSGDGYLIIITHHLDSIGSYTNVDIYEGTSIYVEGADVRINDKLLPEITYPGYIYYTGFNVAGNNYGDEVTFTISIDGESILEQTMRVPSSEVTLTAPDFDWFNLEVYAVNTMDLDDFNAGSRKPNNISRNMIFFLLCFYKLSC